MEITVTAPNRIDLAGGTTDLHPLYLFMEGGCTVVCESLTTPLIETLEPFELYQMLIKVRSGEAPISGKLAVKILQEFREMKQDPEAVT